MPHHQDFKARQWLGGQGLAHGVAREDRTWRFRAETDGAENHAHFHCSRCGRVFCVAMSEAGRKFGLPRGFRVHRMECNLSGLCRDCAAGKAS